MHYKLQQESNTPALFRQPTKLLTAGETMLIVNWAIIHLLIQPAQLEYFSPKIEIFKSLLVNHIFCVEF